MGMPHGKKCTNCGGQALYFESYASYNQHRKDFHSGENYEGDAYKCLNCNNWFDSCEDFTAHIKHCSPPPG